MCIFNKKIPVGATAIVTGASSGIGLEFSRALAEKGINVVLVSNQQEQLDAVAAELRQQYPSLRFEPVFKNLAEADADEWLLEYCKKHGIEVDILINNAGIFNFMKITDMNSGYKFSETDRVFLAPTSPITNGTVYPQA